MTTLNHTAATPYDGRAVTVTVTGLPEQAAQAVADYTDQLTHKLEARRLTRKIARRQAYRIVEKRSRPHSGVLSEERQLELARQGEKAARPAEAEIRIAEPTAGGGAYLRLYDREGGCHERHLWNLSEHPAAGRHVPYAPVTESIDQGAMTRALLDAADERIAGVGFVRPPGATWQPWSRSSAFFTSQRARPQHARVQVTPTAEYLAYVEAAYGPEPQVPQLADGWTVQRRQRGRWTVRKNPAEYWDLTWQPTLRGVRWSVWDERGAPILLRTLPTAVEALALIGAPLA
ncbi:hypothetical protein [Streptomyces sp. NPDC059893]|uniref:hypothetical protein n=1 Tax=Streptomyces sp. NPDC059893 TaxID=3346990 RepID=UPI003660558A